MKILKKVVCFPFVIALGILKLIANVVVRAECYIAVFGIELLGICMIWCLVKERISDENLQYDQFQKEYAL